jgi:hypothetical protein
MITAFNAKLWSMSDWFAISIPAMDGSASSSSPGYCNYVDSLYVIEVHCKILSTSDPMVGC